MEFRYVYQEDLAEMVYDLDPSVSTLDIKSWDIIQSQGGLHLLPIRMEHDSAMGQVHLYYDISKVINLLAWKEKASGEEKEKMLAEISEAVEKLRRLGIPVEQLLLAEKYLYVEKETGQIQMICLPVQDDELIKEIQKLSVKFHGEQEAAPEHAAWGKLVRLSTGETYELTKNRSVIGKKRDSVDLCISKNRTISRNHCVIERVGTQFYLEDLNSSNHTYLNGEFLEAGRQAELKDQDQIRMANEEFIFQVV